MIQLKNGERKSVQASVRNHLISSDVGISSGGHDSAMNPHEILETALAACTSITMQMYAARRNIQIDDILIEVQTVSEGAQSIISRKIQIIGSVSDESKIKLLEIADKCPIHRLLESSIKIETVSL